MNIHTGLVRPLSIYVIYHTHLLLAGYAYSQGVLVLAVFVQDGVPVLVGEGCLYVKCEWVWYLQCNPI